MSRDSSTRTDTKPWYRHPLVWLVILLPASSVIGGLALLTIAIRNADDTVVDDWYREGRTINRTMADEEQARRFGVRATLDFKALPSVQLESRIPVPWPKRLTLKLRHPTVAARDHQLSLVHQGEGRYLGDQQIQPDAEMIVTLAPENGYWRLQQRARLDDLHTVMDAGRAQ